MIALDIGGDKLTIVAWVNRSSAGSGYIVKKADASNGYRLWITATGALQFDVLVGGTTKTVTSTTTLPLNQWKHIAARYDGDRIQLFIDGTIESAVTAVTGSLAATTEPLWLGYYDATDHHLHGYLDDVSIYDHVLASSEVTDLMNDVDKRYEYHHLNALGSNIVLTDDNQNVLARYEYDVFGAIRAETGTSDNTRKFTGKEFDADSKLYYYGARYYDPYIGRFTQRDPIGDGVNWYAYTYNNPLKYVDPTGLRGLTDHERGVVTKIFGNTVSLDDIQIVESGWRHRVATRFNDDNLLTVGNTIYGKNMADSYLIHEVAHVWQYSRNQLDPVTGLAKHGVGLIRDKREGRDQSLYYYTLDDKGDANRRTFGDYGFEQQAQILQDAYRFLIEGRRSKSIFKFNEGFKQHTDDYWEDYYETLLEEFQEYHRQLLDEESSSSGYLEFN